MFQWIKLEMTFQNSSTITDTIFFSNAYKNDWYMALGIALSICNLFALTPFLYAIIWYERFGSDHPRTLINQLVASTCWNGIVHNILFIPLSIFIDLLGPMSFSFCQFNILLKNSIILHLLLMLTIVIFAKYISIYMLKNPTEVLNDFWCFYLNILCVFLAVVSQTAFTVLPGKNPVYFYICTGTNPLKFKTDQSKVNFPLQGTVVLVFVSFICLFLRVKVFSKHSSAGPLVKQNVGWMLPPVKDILEKNSMSSLATISFMLLSLLPSWSMHLTIYILSVDELSTDPYQIIIHFHHHGHKFVFNLLIIMLFLSRPAIRRAVIREMLDRKSMLMEMVGLNWFFLLMWRLFEWYLLIINI